MATPKNNALPKRTAAPKAAPATPKAKRVTFNIHAETGSQVFLAGDFNKWDPTATPLTEKKGTGDFSVGLSLLPGNYEYKFVINGTWCADPSCPDWVKNSVGTLNSVCKVS
jgi:1,4-alpha-glucan branching enzyme